MPVPFPRVSHYLQNWLFARRESTLAAFLIGLLVVIAVRAPEYVAPTNLLNVLIDSSVLCMLVVGQLFVILARGIDLSPAANLAFAGMALALLSHRLPTLPAVAFLGLGGFLGLLLGSINGLLVAVLGVPPIICTLGTMVVFRGLVFLLSGGAWVSAHEMSPAFKSFPLQSMLGFPNIVAIALLTILAAWFFLRFTPAGRTIYAVGSNPLAATFAGISVRRTEFLVFALSGTIAGLCGYLWTARFAIAYTQAAEGREFAIIAACVIGGVSIAGGRGSVAGAVLGALFISVIESALPFVRVSPFLQTAIFGSIILLAVAFNSRSEISRGRQILEVREGGDAPIPNAGLRERSP